jgi:hypothetical protein
MNWGILEEIAAPVVRFYRTRFLTGQGTSQRFSRAVVIDCSAAEFGGRPGDFKSSGATSPYTDFADIVVKVPTVSQAAGGLAIYGGTFALTLPTANGTMSGNSSIAKRGHGSVDLQICKSANQYTTTGAVAFIAGGINNTASGSYSFAQGNTCTASGTNAVAMGNSCVASGVSSFSTGNTCVASSSYSFSSGNNAHDNGFMAKFTRASFRFGAVVGSAQTAIGTYGRQTTDATATLLTADATNTTAAYLPCGLVNDQSIIFDLQIIARNTVNDADSKAFTVTGAIRRGVNAAATALIGTPTVTTIASDGSAWTVGVTADTTNGALAITVTGEVGKTINWVCSARTTEVIG